MAKRTDEEYLDVLRRFNKLPVNRRLPEYEKWRSKIKEEGYNVERFDAKLGYTSQMEAAARGRAVLDSKPAKTLFKIIEKIEQYTAQPLKNFLKTRFEEVGYENIPYISDEDAPEVIGALYTVARPYSVTNVINPLGLLKAKKQIASPEYQNAVKALQDKGLGVLVDAVKKSPKYMEATLPTRGAIKSAYSAAKGEVKTDVEDIIKEARGLEELTTPDKVVAFLGEMGLDITSYVGAGVVTKPIGKGLAALKQAGKSRNIPLLVKAIETLEKSTPKELYKLLKRNKEIAGEAEKARILTEAEGAEQAAKEFSSEMSGTEKLRELPTAQKRIKELLEQYKRTGKKEYRDEAVAIRKQFDRTEELQETISKPMGVLDELKKRLQSEARGVEETRKMYPGTQQADASIIRDAATIHEDIYLLYEKYPKEVMRILKTAESDTEIARNLDSLYKKTKNADRGTVYGKGGILSGERNPAAAAGASSQLKKRKYRYVKKREKELKPEVEQLVSTTDEGWPITVQRIEEPDVKPSFKKPQGLFTTPAEVKSPHLDLGGKRHTYRLNHNAKKIEIREYPIEEVRLRKGAISAGAGVHAARHFLGLEKFNKIKNMSKKRLIEWANKRYKGANFSKYEEGDDIQDIIEGIGSQEAKKKGYDMYMVRDFKDPEYTEIVLLNRKNAVLGRKASKEYSRTVNKIEYLYRVYGDNIATKSRVDEFVAELGRGTTINDLFKKYPEFVEDISDIPLETYALYAKYADNPAMMDKVQSMLADLAGGESIIKILRKYPELKPDILDAPVGLKQKEIKTFKINMPEAYKEFQKRVGDRPTYAQAMEGTEQLAAEFRAGLNKKGTYYRKLNALIKRIKDVGFRPEDKRMLEEGSRSQYNSRVWSQLTDDEIGGIEVALDQFRKTGDATHHARAVQILDNSQAAKNWKAVTEAGDPEASRHAADLIFGEPDDALLAGAIAEPINKETAKQLKRKFGQQGNLRDVLGELFGARTIDDLTQQEAAAFEYYMKNARKVRGKWVHDDLTRVAEGDFIKSMNMRDPLWFEKVTKTFLGSPETVMRELGIENIYKLYKTRWTEMNNKLSDLFDELRALKNETDKIEGSSREIFRALNTLPEIDEDTAKAIKEIKKVKSTKLPPELDEVVKGIRAKQIASLPEELKPAARRIMNIYDELADAQKLPWSARIVNYVTNISYDGAAKQLIDEGILDEVADGVFELSKKTMINGVPYAKGTRLDETLMSQMQKDADIPYRIRRILEFVNPKRITSRFTKKRDKSQFVAEDVWLALDRYLPTTMRKIYLDEPYQMARKIITGENTKNTAAAHVLDVFNQNIRGISRPALGGRKRGKLAQAAYGITNNVFLGALALAPDSALKNLGQGMNVVAELGGDYATRGYKMMLTPEGRKLVMDSGIIDESQIRKLVKLGKLRQISGGKYNKALDKWGDVRDKSMFMFQFAETVNRGTTYLAAYSKYLDEPVKGFKNADEYAQHIVRKLQFDYTEIDIPMALQSPVGRVFGQFLTYPVKQTELIASWIKNGETDKLDRYFRSQYMMLKAGSELNTDMTQFTGAGLSPVGFDEYTGDLEYMPPPVPNFAYKSLFYLIDKGRTGAPWGEPTSDAGKAALQDLKTLVPMHMPIVPGGRYIKKMLDQATNVSLTEKAREMGDVAEDFDKLRQFQQFGEIKSPLLYRPTTEKKRDIPKGESMLRYLASLPDLKRVEQFHRKPRDKQQSEYINKKAREQYGLMKTYKTNRVPELRERIIKLAQITGIDPVEAFKEDKRRIDAGRAGLFETKEKQYGAQKSRDLMSEVLRLEAQGKHAEALKYGRDNGLNEMSAKEINSSVKAYLRELLKAAQADPQKAKEYRILSSIFPKTALTVEEETKALQRSQ